MSNIIKFVLNGCDISFIAEAPEDITLKALLEQCDKIEPNWCACGICSLEKEGYVSEPETEIIIGYDWIKKANDDIACEIVEKESEKFKPGDVVICEFKTDKTRRGRAIYVEENELEYKVLNTNDSVYMPNRCYFKSSWNLIKTGEHIDIQPLLAVLEEKEDE